MTFEELLQQRERKGRTDGRAEGKAEGVAQGVLQGKSESIIMLFAQHGDVSENVRQAILEERDTERLSAGLMLAAEVKSIDEFISRW